MSPSSRFRTKAPDVPPKEMLKLSISNTGPRHLSSCTLLSLDHPHDSSASLATVACVQALDLLKVRRDLAFCSSLASFLLRISFCILIFSHACPSSFTSLGSIHSIALACAKYSCTFLPLHRNAHLSDTNRRARYVPCSLANKYKSSGRNPYSLLLPLTSHPAFRRMSTSCWMRSPSTARNLAAPARSVRSRKLVRKLSRPAR